MSPAAPAPRWRLAVLMGATALLAGWLAWLGHLAFVAGRPVVLYRPQFLVSDLDVVARVKALDEPVVLQEVVWTRPGTDVPEPGAVLRLDNLEDCRNAGWQGPGEYILPLAAGETTFRVVELPPSPGYRAQAGRPRIYPATSATRAQLEQLAKPR